MTSSNTATRSEAKVDHSRTSALVAPSPEQDLDDPTAVPASSSSGPVPNGDDSGDEDEAPDYLRLLSTLDPRSRSSTSSAGIVIPKRGEKDFEPTGFGGQSKLLERSRQAMFTAVSGQRSIGSRSLVRAVWDKRRRRARVQDLQGKIFETVGVIHRIQVQDAESGKKRTEARNELLPEEALFLAERGSLQIFEPAEEEGALAPMSLQQAFTALLSHPDGDRDGEGAGEDEPLTREAYLIYAYLKRLGYVVQRAKIVDAVRAGPVSSANLSKKKEGAKTEGIIADPQRPIQLVTVWDALLYIPCRVVQLGGDAVSWLHKTIARWVSLLVKAATRIVPTPKRNTSTLGLHHGLFSNMEDGRRFLGERGDIKWNSYDAVFSSLQIIPSGHDFRLPTTTASSSSSSASSVAVDSAIQETSSSALHRSDDEDVLRPFFYAWRPATVYRKSHPPPPEFRIVILNARTTPLPSIWEFENVFAQIPIPGSDQELFSTTSVADGGEGMTEEQVKERLEYEKSLKASTEAKNRAAYGKFSDGKQKFLRERAEARKAAAAERRAKNTPDTLLNRFRSSRIGKVVTKLVKLDFGSLRRWGWLFRHSPGCWDERPHGRAGGFKGRGRNNAGATGGGGGGNVFPPLKAGRRSVVVAVVDGSITTLLRFGESEFAQWKLFGFKPQAETEKDGTPA